MLIKTYLPHILLVLITNLGMYSMAQNLVPDPGFELMNRIPDKDDNGTKCTQYWINPTDTWGDYYNRASTSKFAGVPKNSFGYQEAHSGNGYAGFCIQKTMVEYVESKLTNPLIKDQKYLIEFYISKADNLPGSVKEIGVVFNDRVEDGYPNTGIEYKPAISFINKNGFKDEKEWTKLSATYVAEGYEAAFIIGYFPYDGRKIKNLLAHYYIDDVTISPVLEEKTLHKKLPTKDSIMPFAPKPGETITLKNIFFETNKSDLLTTSYEELNKLVEYLLKNTYTSIEIRGHTDNTGKEDDNNKLSEARAKAVADYLISKAIAKERITYKGFGSTKPIATNNTDEGKKQNRRVEFIIKEK